MSPNPGILLPLDAYLPAFRGGGPIRSIVNLISQLATEFDFRIITSDRDFRTNKPLEGVQSGFWRRVDGADVLYVAPEALTMKRWTWLLQTTPHDILYLNSFFSRRFSIMPMFSKHRRMGNAKPIVIAPRGEFMPGALAQKNRRKELYLALARRRTAYAEVMWHATTPEESELVRRFFATATVQIARNVPSALPSHVPSPSKSPGSLRMVYLSRIVSKKNLLWGLDLLGTVSGNIELDVFGPIEDTSYWSRCTRSMDRLPAHVKVRYRGVLPPSSVVSTLSQYHLFFLPTLGENYAHAIHEALLAGCLVLLSDRTPWRRLDAQGIGWDLPLHRPASFRAAIHKCLGMDHSTFYQLAQRAREFALVQYQEHIGPSLDEHRRLFRVAVGDTVET